MASLSITALYSYFVGEQKSISRGENHYKSNHVESFSYDQGVLRGQVRASMKKKVYKVTIYLNPANEIKSSECECPRGEYKCSHAAALYIHGIYNLSRTDVQCEWKKKKNSQTTTQSVEEMFPPSKPGYVALSRKPTEEDRANLYSQLRSYGKFTGLCWIMSPEPPQAQSLPIPSIEEIIFSEEFLGIQGADDQRNHIAEKAKVDNAAINVVSSLTIGQRNNSLWHLARKGRLTASNFGCVLNAKRATPSLIKRLLGEYDISRVKAVAWGVANESEAVRAFTSQTGLDVQETGIWLDKSGVLGASPDGLVGQKHLLEVKCPYTARNMTLHEAMESKSFFLEMVDGLPSLKKDHVYWHQVQGQMFLTQRHVCYFVVWTTKQSIILTIKRDNEWEVNIDLLKYFYYLHIFPKITEGEL